VVGSIYVALGSNLGDRAATLASALRELDMQPLRVLRSSRVHETEPVGGPPQQGRYLNAVAEIDTPLPPRELLERLHAIERRHGRVRRAPNGPRTLDLDLLLYRDLTIDEPGLCVPHPRMWERAFVLGPLAELCDVAAVRRRFHTGACI
jgi:2-amino-4-hydroxy-6-hydroxymethyldihydropteridine diphosphokinase